MHKRVWVMGVCGLGLLAIGSAPRMVEELQVGGGYGEASDGGVDVEADGDVFADGVVAAGGLALGDGAAAVFGDDADFSAVYDASENRWVLTADETAAFWLDRDVSTIESAWTHVFNTAVIDAKAEIAGGADGGGCTIDGTGIDADGGLNVDGAATVGGGIVTPQIGPVGDGDLLDLDFMAGMALLNGSMMTMQDVTAVGKVEAGGELKGGGGYGSTGCTGDSAGNFSMNGALTVDGVSTLTGALTATAGVLAPQIGPSGDADLIDLDLMADTMLVNGSLIASGDVAVMGVVAPTGSLALGDDVAAVFGNDSDVSAVFDASENRWALTADETAVFLLDRDVSVIESAWTHEFSTVIIDGVATTGSLTAGAAAAVTDGCELLRLAAYGDDGDSDALAGYAGFEVDGTPGDGDMPGRFVVATTPDGSETPVDAFEVGPDGDADLLAGAPLWWTAHLPASMFTPGSSDGCGALEHTVYSAGSREIDTLPFDKDANETAFAAYRMPDWYDGRPLTATVAWIPDSGCSSGDVLFEVMILAYGDDDAISGGTSGSQSDTGTDAYIADGDLHEFSVTPDPLDEPYLLIRVKRWGGSGGDTLDGDADFAGLTLSL